MTEEAIQTALDLAREPRSLNTLLDQDSGTEFGDLLGMHNPEDSPEIQALSHAVTEGLNALLDATLTDREYEVLVRRKGLGGRKAETLDEIAPSFNLTRERIRQIEAKAMAKLRAQADRHKLQYSDYL